MKPNDSLSPLLRSLRSQLDPELVKQLQAIYLSSFPPSEREEFQSLIDGVTAETRWLSTVEQDGQLLSFATVLPLADTDVQYLEYFATAEQARGKGIGRILQQFICAYLRSQGDVSGLLMEVQSENAGPPEERPLRLRRIEFYGRHDGRLVDGAPNYFAPNLAGEGVIPFHLMWIPIRGDVQLPAGARLRQCVTSIYRQCYGRPADDPLVQTVLDGLTD
jgi:GNAT superfamily N-acetyltransferase